VDGHEAVEALSRVDYSNLLVQVVDNNTTRRLPRI